MARGPPSAASLRRDPEWHSGVASRNQRRASAATRSSERSLGPWRHQPDFRFGGAVWRWCHAAHAAPTLTMTIPISPNERHVSSRSASRPVEVSVVMALMILGPQDAVTGADVGGAQA